MKKDKRTYKDRRKYNIEAVARRRKQIRLKAIKHLGGKCIRCGYYKYPEACQEIEKCDLLCANCHREVHVEQNKLAAPRGNLRMNSE